MTVTNEPKHLSTTECARMIRKLLAQAFEGTKFGVRSRRYAGGSSITVKWVDGPLRDAVQAIAQQLEGSRFDGMTDMKESMGPRMVAGELILPMVDYVFCEREVTDFDARAATAERMIRERCSLSEGGTGRDYFCSTHVSDLARAMVHALPIDGNGTPDFERAFLRVVMRQA